jgi:hypothetical protein
LDLKNERNSKISLVIFSAIFLTCSIVTNSAYGSAGCPEYTKWNGENCVNVVGEQIVFKNSQEPKKQQETIITKRDHEILNDLLIIKPEKIKIENMTGKALEQKIFYDVKFPNNLDRSNYYFNEVKKLSIKNAELTMNLMFNGKDIQNANFGKNNNKQIEYGERLQRSEDPVLQNQIIHEKIIAEGIFLKTWGNFTNH